MGCSPIPLHESKKKRFVSHVPSLFQVLCQPKLDRPTQLFQKIKTENKCTQVKGNSFHFLSPLPSLPSLLPLPSRLLGAERPVGRLDAYFHGAYILVLVGRCEKSNRCFLVFYFCTRFEINQIRWCDAVMEVEEADYNRVVWEDPGGAETWMMRRSQQSKDLEATLQGDGSTIQRRPWGRGIAAALRNKMNLVKEVTFRGWGHGYTQGPNWWVLQRLRWGNLILYHLQWEAIGGVEGKYHEAIHIL